jgi:methylated-DNA-[protein]-cysteine S-methyltransferase
MVPGRAPRRGAPTASLFPSAIGHCGIAWSDVGIVALQLPAGDRPRTRRLLAARSGARLVAGAPPPPVASLILRIQRHLDGDLDPLQDARLDLRGLSPFREAVSLRLRGVGPGQTVTYGELALLIGRPGAARAVGRVVAHNPLPLLVPCHRVLPAGGGTGGFSAPGGVELKRRLLELEGASR